MSDIIVNKSSETEPRNLAWTALRGNNNNKGPAYFFLDSTYLFIRLATLAPDGIKCIVASGKPAFKVTDLFRTFELRKQAFSTRCLIALIYARLVLSKVVVQIERSDIFLPLC